MTQAIIAFADYAFRQLKLRRLTATPFINNIASQWTLKKAGFVRIGILKEHLMKDGAYIDVVLFERIVEPLNC
jgi:RimJ/RimL family protein N-acetyltransferase